MKKSTKVNFRISLPVSVHKEGKYFIAYTPALDLSTSGKSPEEVKRRFEEIIQIFLEELLAKGTLGEVLLGLGWRRIQKQWAPPQVISQKIENFNIPIDSLKNAPFCAN